MNAQHPGDLFWGNPVANLFLWIYPHPSGKIIIISDGKTSLLPQTHAQTTVFVVVVVVVNHSVSCPGKQDGRSEPPGGKQEVYWPQSESLHRVSSVCMAPLCFLPLCICLVYHIVCILSFKGAGLWTLGRTDWWRGLWTALVFVFMQRTCFSYGCLEAEHSMFWADIMMFLCAKKFEKQSFYN